jgi:hypothetical protein
VENDLKKPQQLLVKPPNRITPIRIVYSKFSTWIFTNQTIKRKKTLNMNSSFPISQQINSKKVNDLSSPMAPPMSCMFSCQLSAGPTKTAASRAKRSKIFSSAGNFASVRLGKVASSWDLIIYLWV